MLAENNDKKISRREREKLARRRGILTAARKVFGARGYEGATLDEVAREAEFAKGTLYSYFDSKAELFAAAWPSAAKAASARPRLISMRAPTPTLS